MRIGLFTDSYHPATNGVVYVVDIARKRLEEAGHEVWIFCPASKELPEDDEHIVQFRGVKIPGSGKDGPMTSVFDPFAARRKVAKLNLDIIHFYSPSVLGFFAVFCATKLGIRLVAQHSTDTIQYLDLYPTMKVGAFFGAVVAPMLGESTSEQKKKWAKDFLPSRKSEKVFSRRMMENMLLMMYENCDSVVALSRKSKEQLVRLGLDKSKIIVMPTGVDALPKVDREELKEFRRENGLAQEDEVLLYVGRLSREKNLAILVSVIEEVARKRPQAKLVFVGDNEYKKELEAIAAESSARENIIFTGRVPREKLSMAYGVAKIFMFPSMTDTQGLVLNEAVASGLPVVAVDGKVSEVVQDGKNGFIVKNNAKNMASRVLELLEDPELYGGFAAQSKKIAGEFTEKKQTKKQIELYCELMGRDRVDTSSSRWA